jgi:hypothetical protein
MEYTLEIEMPNGAANVESAAEATEALANTGENTRLPVALAEIEDLEIGRAIDYILSETGPLRPAEIEALCEHLDNDDESAIWALAVRAHDGMLRDEYSPECYRHPEKNLEILPYESLKDYAADYIQDIGEIPDYLMHYFDLDGFAEALEADGFSEAIIAGRDMVWRWV